MEGRSYERDERGWERLEALLPPDRRARPGEAPRESFERLAGFDVHLDEHGTGAGGTGVVCLHGGGGTGRLLAPVARAVARAGHGAVAPDLPGYGLTTCPPARMRYPAWVDVAAAVVARERARRDRVIVFGMSMGGLLAVHATAAVPAGAVDTVLVTNLLDPRDRATMRAAARFPTPPPGWLAPLDRLRLPIGLVVRLDRMANDPGVRDAIVGDPAGAARRVPLGFWRSWMQYAPPVDVDRFDRAPVVLAHPGDDRWTPVEHSRRTLARIPAPTREVPLPDGGHAPLEPRAVAALDAVLTDLLVPAVA